MTTGAAGIIGRAPQVTIGITERKKYEMMWEKPEYRQVAPGEGAAMRFLEIAKPPMGSEVIDFGTGTGRGAIMLALMGSLKVKMVDFADNCLDPEVKQALTTQSHVLTFYNQDLCKKIDVSAEFGYCTDVMEHIPPQLVDKALDNILKAAQHVFFQISTVPDSLGKLIGHELHLTVKPYEWWLEQFRSRGCMIHWSENLGHECQFYVTAWAQGKDFPEIGVLNLAEDKVLENVKANVAGPWKTVQPHETNDIEVMIVGGGPSLAGQIETIKQLRREGAKLVTLNGAYNWAIENGMDPSAQIIVDAREFNARFTKPVHPTCKYLIASQCDPKVLEGLPEENTYLWHTTDKYKDLLDARYPVWWTIPGGSTVMLRAIPLLRLLGFRKFHIFGFDSCLVEDTHHAYAQPENDSELVINVTVGGRVFKCHAWMVSQAQEFMDTIKFMGNLIELEIYGDGLPKHILTTGAEIADMEAAKNGDPESWR